MRPTHPHAVRGALLLLLLAAAGSCARSAQVAADPPSRYLYVWVGPQMDHSAAADTGHHHAATASDFIAVFDADTASATYGQVITTVPVEGAGAMAHHTEYSLSDTRTLFANDYMAGRVVVLDFADPRAPRLRDTMDSIPGYRRPHTFARLPNGHVLVTLQYGDGSRKGDPGGLAELDPAGKLIRVSSSADPAFPDAAIRTYGLEVLPAIDRAITTSSPMGDEPTAHVVQLWRLSDLTLLRTMEVPKVAGDSVERYPFEIRTLPGGRTALMHSYFCGFYHLTDLDTDAPRIELVHTLRNPATIGCSVPTIVGNYAVVPIAYGHRIVSFDISNPAKLVEVSALETDSTFFPHWSSADPSSDRLVITEQGDGAPRIAIIRIDRATGRLSWDDRFRDADSTRPGISFARASWPHGTAGKVMPHGAVFGR